jgi:hypothetical protein
VLTAFNGEGCIDRDTVVVVVNEPILASVSIADDVAARPGGVIDAPIELDLPLDREMVTSFELTLTFDERMIVMDGLEIDGTLTDDWSVAELENAAGRYRAVLSAPPGETLTGSGILARILARGFVGPAPRSPLTAAISIPTDRCATIAADSGSIRIDSICGLAARMIFLNETTTALGPITPNPFNPIAHARFTLGVAGTTRLRVLDPAGREVLTLVDGLVSEGEHEVVIDATSLASGVYRCVLEVDGSIAGARAMTVVK